MAASSAQFIRFKKKIADLITIVEINCTKKMTPERRGLVMNECVDRDKKLE